MAVLQKDTRIVQSVLQGLPVQDGLYRSDQRREVSFAVVHVAVVHVAVGVCPQKQERARGGRESGADSSHHHDESNAGKPGRFAKCRRGEHCTQIYSSSDVACGLFLIACLCLCFPLALSLSCFLSPFFSLKRQAHTILSSAQRRQCVSQDISKASIFFFFPKFSCRTCQRHRHASWHSPVRLFRSVAFRTLNSRFILYSTFQTASVENSNRLFSKLRVPIDCKRTRTFEGNGRLREAENLTHPHGFSSRAIHPSIHPSIHPFHSSIHPSIQCISSHRGAFAL